MRLATMQELAEANGYKYKKNTEEEEKTTTPKGLVGKVYPQFFTSCSAFGLLKNYFPYLKGIDKSFIPDEIEMFCPEKLDLLKYKTKEQWKTVIDFTELTKQTTSNYIVNDCDYRIRITAICFPKTDDAIDYHFVIFNGLFWIEQAEYGGEINIWEHKYTDYMLNNILNRTDKNGVKLYTTAFQFLKSCDW